MNRAVTMMVARRGRDRAVGEGSVLFLTAQPAQHLPAGEPGQDLGLVGRQGAQELVQPRGGPFQLGVKGRQDPQGGEQVVQVVVGPVGRERVEGRVGDLKLAAGHRT